MAVLPLTYVCHATSMLVAEQYFTKAALKGSCSWEALFIMLDNPALASTVLIVHWNETCSTSGDIDLQGRTFGVIIELMTDEVVKLKMLFFFFFFLSFVGNGGLHKPKGQSMKLFNLL
ncbi:hypothetical protein BP00DRAFT_226637 [Aspergillus indologenus CBS 114.80]|uniref:Uncharacterized protein n=1 Tax=Aspergillus indologenus CBS 114.80 TaxID=1450541 RepID=A0A2V5IMI8_9EURO|nr:hypothetical protein BP00DRAFT_226637 [Aspergillus indologenus CBS 114.80]